MQFYCLLFHLQFNCFYFVEFRRESSLERPHHELGWSDSRPRLDPYNPEKGEVYPHHPHHVPHPSSLAAHRRGEWIDARGFPRSPPHREPIVDKYLMKQRRFVPLLKFLHCSIFKGKYMPAYGLAISSNKEGVTSPQIFTLTLFRGKVQRKGLLPPLPLAFLISFYDMQGLQ